MKYSPDPQRNGIIKGKREETLEELEISISSLEKILEMEPDEYLSVNGLEIDSVGKKDFLDALILQYRIKLGINGTTQEDYIKVTKALIKRGDIERDDLRKRMNFYISADACFTNGVNLEDIELDPVALGFELYYILSRGIMFECFCRTDFDESGGVFFDDNSTKDFDFSILGYPAQLDYLEYAYNFAKCLEEEYYSILTDEELEKIGLIYIVSGLKSEDRDSNERKESLKNGLRYLKGSSNPSKFEKAIKKTEDELEQLSYFISNGIEDLDIPKD